MYGQSYGLKCLKNLRGKLLKDKLHFVAEDPVGASFRLFVFERCTVRGNHQYSLTHCVFSARGVNENVEQPHGGATGGYGAP